MIVEDMVVRVSADTEGLKRDLTEVRSLAGKFTAGLSTAFDQVVFKGRDLGDVLRSIALRLSSSAFHAAFRPLEQGLANAITGLVGNILPFRAGGVVGPNGVTPFASGGIVGSPTLFPAGPSGFGLMGEAGAEAILPLQRGADGRLGVKADGGGRGVTVNVTIQTPDIEGFTRARGRVAAELARAVDKGRRNL